MVQDGVELHACTLASMQKKKKLSATTDHSNIAAGSWDGGRMFKGPKNKKPRRNDRKVTLVEVDPNGRHYRVR